MRYQSLCATILLAVLLATLVPVGQAPLRAQAGFVVTQCQEGAEGAEVATLKAALDQGQPLITFDCPGAAFINIRETYDVAANTRIDGANKGTPVTLVNAIPSGEGPNARIVPALQVLPGVELEVINVRFASEAPFKNAGIWSRGALRVINARFQFFADGIAGDQGMLLVRNTRFTDNLRGITLYGSLQQAAVTNSLFMSNNSGVAGVQSPRPPVDGVYVVSTSIFSNNSAAVQSCSGDDCISLLDLTIANSIITLNREGSPAVVGRGIHLVNSTVVNNPDVGVRSEDGTITLVNTIVAYNRAGNCTGAVIDGGGNLQYPDAACGAAIRVGLPLLSPLLEPQLGSAAIGAGDLSVCASPVVSNTDYYGQKRPRGAGCSSGAVEGMMEQPPVFPVPNELHDG